METVEDLITEVLDARAAKIAADERLSLALQRAVLTMVDELGYNKSATARLLELSHQRIHQLLAAHRPAA